MGVHLCVLYLHTLVIRLLSEGDVSDCESTAVWAPEMINAVTESPRLSRFSRAVRVGARFGWQLSLLDSCPEETEGGAARSDGETSRVWHWCPSVSQSARPRRRDSLIETKQNNYSWTLSEIWASVLQCCYSRVAIRGEEVWYVRLGLFQSGIKSYFTSRLRSKEAKWLCHLTFTED